MAPATHPAAAAAAGPSAAVGLLDLPAAALAPIQGVVLAECLHQQQQNMEPICGRWGSGLKRKHVCVFWGCGTCCTVLCDAALALDA